MISVLQKSSKLLTLENQAMTNSQNTENSTLKGASHICTTETAREMDEGGRKNVHSQL